MNIKDMIVPVVLAFLITLGIQRYLVPLVTPAQQGAGPTFVAPRAGIEQLPINTEINFVDTKKIRSEELTEVTTKWSELVFSNHGASLQSLDYKRNVEGALQTMRTVFPSTPYEREKRCFLVAFDDQTPYYYTLTGVEKSDARTTITYQAEFDQATVRKTFIVHDEQPVIDIKLAVDLKEDTKALQPRLFFAAPTLPYLTDGDMLSGIAIDSAAQFNKTAVTSLQEDKGWLAPQLFGMDDRYFIHAMIADKNQFASRAYYKLAGNQELYGILESTPVQKSTEWDLSFYCGPKDIDYISAVDQRLERSLDYYGWFAPISKGLLKILKWLYSYFANYGIAIIILTLILKLLLLPLTMHSEQKMRMQREMQKKLAYIEQRYAHDPEKLQIERAAVARESSAAILGGCLPVLLQIPMFFALSRLLPNAIELYQAPLWWISDLSSKDPYYVFPILFGLGMMGSGLMNNTDPKQRMTNVVMALVFVAFTSNLSAGLSLYICASAIFSLAQTYAVKLLGRA